ncbi:DUF418 domain-containing protein [Streptomyces pseudogriseolus]|uniref:DUF418 domain-containing protein n=1 Tax=Streptomyces pseudogriseolus TaxID=36817 RepID=UPI003FA24BDC
MTETLRPRTPTRLLDVDALRGFALFGILVVNLAYFASGYPFHLVADPAHGSWLDDSVEFGVRLLFEMKFYLLFSFLFGYSFTLQLAAAGRAGANFTARFVRRLGGLFVLGGLHAVLLFQGDILTTYALLGLVLLAVHRIQPRTAVIAAGAIVGVVAVGTAVAALAGVELVTDQEAALAAGRASTDALAGGLGSVIGEHLRSLPTMAGSLAVQGPLALAAFLVGLAAGQRKLLADGVGRHTGALRRLELVGYPIGLAGALVFAIGGGTTNLAGLAVSILTAPLLVSAYVATLLRVFATPRASRPDGAVELSRSVPAGRADLHRRRARADRRHTAGGRAGRRRRHLRGPAGVEPTLARAVPVRPGRMGTAGRHERGASPDAPLTSADKSHTPRQSRSLTARSHSSGCHRERWPRACAAGSCAATTPLISLPSDTGPRVAGAH